MSERTLQDALEHADKLRARERPALTLLEIFNVLLADEIGRLKSESDKHARACTKAIERLVTAEDEIKRLRDGLDQVAVSLDPRAAVIHLRYGSLGSPESRDGATN